MIFRNTYPICEYDTSRKPVINPADFLEKTLPSKCVLTFFRKELEQLAEERGLPVIGKLHSEILDIPIYEYRTSANRICIAMPYPTSPGAAETIEDLHAMGCGQFIICGGAGALKRDSRVGEIIVPVAAVRDEGTSYHYLEPSREVECHRQTADAVMAGLERMGIPFTVGKTWTTDAIYRETPDMIELRRSEGCVTVEMETAAFFAVSKFYDIPLAQLLYAGDDVSGEEWDRRNWDRQKSVRANLISTSIKLIDEL